jgi:hypothetical protein
VNLKERNYLEKPTHRWKDNIKHNLRNRMRECRLDDYVSGQGKLVGS